MAIMAGRDLCPAFSDPLNCSVSSPFPRPLLDPGFLPRTPPPMFWTVGLLVCVLMVASTMIFYTPFPSAYLRGQNCFPTLEQTLCGGLVFQSLSGLQSCLSVGCIELISAHSSSWLHAGRLSKFARASRGRNAQIGLRLKARVLMFRRGALKGCLLVGREGGGRRLGVGSGPLLSGLDALFGGLAPVRVPVRNPLDIVV